MDQNEKNDLESNPSLPSASSLGLKGKQSVRTTFKLSENTIAAVSIVAAHLGIKQKSLFDHLFEDVQSLCSIASEIQRTMPRKQTRIQKTYVISRKSLYSLEKISKDYDASRDALIEYSVQRLLPIIKKEKERHKNRKEILPRLRRYVQQGKALLADSKALLDEDDPVYTELQAAVTACESAYLKIEAFIEKGRRIEDF